MQFSDFKVGKMCNPNHKVDNSVLPEPEIFSFITRFLLENRVFLHLKRINHNNFYYCIFLFTLLEFNK